MKRRDFIKSVAATGVIGLSEGLLFPGAQASGPTPAPAFPRRPLGSTGERVTVLALGGVIGMQRPPAKDFDPTELAEAAFEAGIRYFDTAPSYNNGQSETNYGPAVERHRKDIFLATKTQKRTYDEAMREFESSLKRLRTDHVDLLQLHGMNFQDRPDLWDKPDGVLPAFRKLRDQKAVRFLGITGHEDAVILRRAIEMYEFDTLLTTLNPVSRRRPFREDLLPAANRKKMGVIAMKVMGGGNGCLAAGNPSKKLIQLFHDDTSSQVPAKTLVRYALGLPISVAVIGVASVEQLRENIAAAVDLPPLSDGERKTLEDRVG